MHGFDETTTPINHDTLSMTSFNLGEVDLLRAEQMQRKMIEESLACQDGCGSVLLCEHPTTVTIGRGGSLDQVATWQKMITSGEVEVRWVPRGGGAMVHTPGQLAIYPIVPLELLGISIGDYLERLLGVLLEVLDVMKVKAYTSDDQTSIVGRTGTLAHIGIGIRNGITWHGAFLNVSPCLGLKNLLHQPDKSKELRETSLVAERQKGVTMPQVRSLVLERLATALGYAEHHPVSRV